MKLQLELHAEVSYLVACNIKDGVHLILYSLLLYGTTF